MNLIRSSETSPRDPLSDFLALLDVKSFLSRRLEGSGSWALRFPAFRHMKFGCVIEGSRWLWTENTGAPVQLAQGDFYLLSHGRPYCFASDVSAKPVDGVAFMERHAEPDGVVRFNGGEGRTVGVGGRFVLDDETSDLLLSMLPPVIHIRGSLPQARALRAVLDLISFETETARPGGTAAAGALCAIVLVNILRVHLASGDRPQGWLGALHDRQVGATLRLFHGDLAKRWDVAGLAHVAGMSRTAFADRFKTLVGMAPLEYMIHWRMIVARNALTRDAAKLATIARSIGYESETAFSLAFKRKFGDAPGRYRLRMRQAAGAEGESVASV